MSEAVAGRAPAAIELRRRLARSSRRGDRALAPWQRDDDPTGSSSPRRRGRAGAVRNVVFLRPDQLRRHEPARHALLAGLYRVDL